MDKIFVNFLPPWVETNIQPAFYDKESGSVLQQTARMYAKVQCLVRMFNKLSKETKETVDEYIAKFVELKDFVDTYFENLDVQEEINNKLDEMADDGTLQEIIGDYLNATAVWGFDTVADMQSSTNLIDGSYARCLGHTTIKDGRGGLYKIRTVTTADVVDGVNKIALTDTLLAELIDSQISIKNQADNDVKLISDKYSFSVEYINNTFVYKTVIPKANISKFALLATNGDTSNPHGAGRKSVYNLANSVDYDILINAGLHGIMIFDGTSYVENNDSPYYIGFTEDLEMHFYDAVNNTITLATLEADNIVNACCGYSPLIVNGEAYDYTAITSAGTSISDYFRDYIVPIRHTRQIIAEDDDSIILYSVIGRKNRSFGMTYDELITWLGNENVTNAFNLDGGGSTQEVITKTMTYPSQDYDNGRGRVVPTAFGFKFKE